MDKMPHGIVDKQVAGIGATSLEIDSKRNSIIVFPTKILAYNKWQRNKTKLLYVGGKINDERDTTSIKEIQSYLSDDKVVYKKFLVVADSLYKLLQIIGKEHYKDYFLMIDEVDMIQSESNYRPSLESLIDHYFEFPPKNRCLVTATMREFSNPQLQQECKFNLSWKDAPKRKIQLYYTDNLDALTSQQIQFLPPTEKIVIAYNSIRHCRNIIKLLPDEHLKDCAILCSDSSVEEAGTYYAELAEGNKLPKRINFITSCYFAGVDIEDYYHLITVSNARQNYQMLSPDKLTQIHGRCRFSNGILSDTIIYNTREKWRQNADGDYQATLLKQADALLHLQKSASELKVFVGFQNMVCCNMCVSTDGYKSEIKVMNTQALFQAVMELFQLYNPEKHTRQMQTLVNSSMTEHQFAQLLGKSRLYQCLPQEDKKRLPQLLMTDTQINLVARAYYQDEAFGVDAQSREISMWKVYNLLTGANKSSYIDNFLDRALNASQLAEGINKALYGESEYRWFVE